MAQDPLNSTSPAAAPAQDAGARDRLMSLTYTELHRLAHHFLKGEREWASAKAWLHHELMER